MIYATPTTGARQNIILGYLDSGVSALTVTDQFIDIDCGNVFVNEYFLDVRDYSPFTTADIYLPFIGIKRVNTEDIVGCNVNIVYHVDVLTGALICNINITKRGATQTLYTYAGNCSVQIPLTGSDRTRLLSGAISGAVHGASVGGAVGGVIGMAVGGFTGGASVERTGSFSANAGAMGIKKPYIILNSKIPYDASQYNKLYGFPSNTTVVLGNCKGYTKIKSVHVENVGNATENEKNTIESLLKNGVIIQ